MDINRIFKELAEYKRLQDEINANVDSIQDEIKQYMIKAGITKLNGVEHCATYTPVTQSRIDSKGLKVKYPEIAEQFTKQSTYNRFTFK